MSRFWKQMIFAHSIMYTMEVALTKMVISSYIAQYPVLSTAQTSKCLTLSSVADLFNQTPSQVIWE